MSSEKGKARRPDQLPPGRHGLGAEFVFESQRKRLLDAVIESVAAQGYLDMRISDVIARAGVSRKTFYEHFDDKEECFLAAYDLELAQLIDAAASAFAGEGPRPWPEQVRDGVRGFLRYLAEHPAAARVFIVDALGAGQRAIAKREAAVRSFTYFVDAGRSDTIHEVPGRVALAVLGGINELLAGELLHGSAENVGTLAPDMVYLITLPFLGPERALAEREATRKALERERKPARRRARASSAPGGRAGGARSGSARAGDGERRPKRG